MPHRAPRPTRPRPCPLLQRAEYMLARKESLVRREQQRDNGSSKMEGANLA